MIQIYKPNKSNTGAACSFGVKYDEDNLSRSSIFLNIIKQHSWNEQTGNGSFSENKDDKENSIAIKFNIFEAGKMISAINDFRPVAFFHKTEDYTTQISITPWAKKYDFNERGSKKEYTEKCFGVSVSRNGNTFKIPLDSGEIECVKIFLQKCISKTV